MRFPLIRSPGDDTPIAWWEIFCAPVAVPLICFALAAALVLSIPASLLYPERKLINSTDQSTADGRERIAEIKRQESQTSLLKRVATAPLLLIGIVILVPVFTIYDALIGQWRTKR